MFLSLIFTAVFLLAGFFASYRIFNKEETLVTVLFSIVFSLALMMWVPFFTSLLLGFTFFSQITALILVLPAAAFGILSFLRTKQSLNIKTVDKTAFILLIPFLFFTFYLLHTHTLFVNENGGLSSGQSTYGDMAMHLSFITGLSEMKSFPPTYSLLKEPVPIGYPFLCDSISSTFYTLGASLRQAYILPMLLAFTAVYLGAYLFLKHIFKDKAVTIFAFFLFFIGGGFGFAYFFDTAKEQTEYTLETMMNGFYLTPTNLIGKNVRFVNIIADMLIPQRATLFGYSVLFACLLLLFKAEFEDNKKYFIPLAVLAGSLPLIHTHSFLALGIISAFYLITYLIKHFRFIDFLMNLEKLQYWLVYGVLTAVLSLPQLFLFVFKQSSAGNFVQGHLNWGNINDSYIWFYIKNIGLVFILTIPAFLHAPKETKRLYGGFLAVLLIAEIVIFQPNTYDNNKLIYVWYLATCGLAANYLLYLYRRLNDVRGTKFIAAVMVIVMNLSGVMTLARETVSSYELFGASHVEASEFIKKETDPDSLFLTSNNHNNAVASLTGRRIYCGSGSYLYFHGINYMQYEQEAQELLKRPTIQTMFTSGVDYVYISDFERYGLNADEAFFMQNYTMVFDNGSIRIYKIR